MKLIRIRVAGVLMLGALSVAAAPVAWGEEPDPLMVQLELQQSAMVRLGKQVGPTVVSIISHRMEKGRGGRRLFEQEENEKNENSEEEEQEIEVPAVGSGVVIRSDGMILTNEHVVSGAHLIHVVTHTGRPYEGTIVSTDRRSDLAVIHIDAEGLPEAVLGDLSHVQVGHFAVAMGNPFGLSGDGRASMSIGVVSNLGRELRFGNDERYYGNLIATDAAINPGNSGGPLLNIRGDVIGINTAISTRTGANEGVGFAVPIGARTKAIIEHLLEGNEVEYGFLGVVLNPVPLEERIAIGDSYQAGARVYAVRDNTPARTAGLEPGDVVVQFDDQKIVNEDHLVRVVGGMMVGRTFEVKFIRNGEEKQTKITLTRRPMGNMFALRSQQEDRSFRWQGIVLMEPTETVREQFKLAEDLEGVVVVDVVKGTKGFKAGFKRGEVIEKIGETTIKTLSELREARRVHPGAVEVVVRGAGSRSLGQ
jgi:serine protease Do